MKHAAWFLSGVVVVGTALFLRTPPKPKPAAFVSAASADRISYDDLDLQKMIYVDVFRAEDEPRIPESIRKLDGRRVILRGFMKPAMQATGLPQFLQVRDTGMCCSGPVARLYHAVAVTLKEGSTTDYIEMRPFDVEGKFRIEVVEFDDGLVGGLYFLDDASVIAK